MTWAQGRRSAQPPGRTALAEPAPAAVAPLPALRRLGSTLRGLTEAEAEARLHETGENVVALPHPPTWPARLTSAARSPFVLILAALAAASAATGEPRGAAAIAGLAAVSCTLRASQERRFDQVAAALAATVPATATVVRRAAPDTPSMAREVLAEQLVPGDIVALAAGDLVPADLMLLRCDGLTVDQAALTGESHPVAKSAAPASGPGLPVPTGGVDAGHLCFAGSAVTAGTATGLVLATGDATYLGCVAGAPQRRGETCFDRGVRSVAGLLVGFTAASVPVVLAVNAALRGHSLQAVLFALAVAVGLTPEMLPVVVTAALARGARRMAGQAVVVRRLPAIHNIGAMDVLCTDKTGTLTEGVVTFDRAVDAMGRDDLQVLRWAWLNSQAALSGEPAVDPLDLGVLEHAGKLGLAGEAGADPVDVVPFDPVRRRVTVVLPGGAGRHTLVTKGAPAEVIGCCTHVRSDGGDARLGATARWRAQRLAEGCAAQGVRLLAVAVAARPTRLGRYSPADEAGLTLVGFIGFRDLPKASARQGMADLAAAGVAVKVVTGDHPAIAVRVCRDIGIEPGRPLTGRQLARLDDAMLARLATGTTVFARVDPAAKARVVRALRSAGHTVGFLADGTNDVPALRAADVGVCVAGSVAATRECADVVLARKDLTDVGLAVRTGRTTFTNIANYLKITVSANLGNVAAMLVASLAMPFLPMLPIQVLVQNLCWDVCQLGLAFDRAGGGPARTPRTFDTRDLARFALIIGPVNLVTDLVTFAFLWRAIGAHVSPAGLAVFRAGWFTENLLTQAVAVHLLRSHRWPCARDHATLPVLLATAGLAVVGCLPFTPLAQPLGMRALPASYLLFLTAAVAGFCLATATAKGLYLRGSRCQRR
ncbi:MAG TPA: magnesium-translocating P-type ATPase [Streptosporangiaceae bacterium]|nr:magnesium-translocating P-type ATPase [Streptosporangiaceae bacterium]